MIIGKFLDPRAPSLPQQVGINTDDIADILQENEEQSANIQQNTDDIELLKQQVSESGTRVRVDGELVAEWSPDELTDDLQQVKLAQSSDSLAIVGLQSDNITNKQNISTIQGNISQLNQESARALKTPISAPSETEIPVVDENNAQDFIPLSSIQEKRWNIVNGDAGENVEIPVQLYRINELCIRALGSDQATFGFLTIPRAAMHLDGAYGHDVICIDQTGVFRGALNIKLEYHTNYTKVIATARGTQTGFTIYYR